MKKLLLLLFIFGSINQSNAQTINGMPIEDIPAKYLEIVAVSKKYKKFQVTIALDYGQIEEWEDLQSKKGQIIGDDGKEMSFNGVMAALNFLNKKGFKYVSQYVLSIGVTNAYHILLENTNYKE